MSIEQAKLLEEENASNEAITKLRQEIELCVKLDELMAGPCKKCAYAVSRQWINQLKEYGSSCKDVSHNVTELQKQLVHAQYAQDQAAIHQQITVLIDSTQGCRPGPVLNLDLVYLDPVYTNKMMKVNNNVELTMNQGNNQSFNGFNDWAHMSLKESMISQLQDKITREYQGGIDDLNVYQQDFDKTEETDMVLVSNLCWMKMTHYFGKIGPEIRFFCIQDPITKSWMPDLEPLKINVRQFDQKVNQNNSKQVELIELSEETPATGTQELISKNQTVKQFIQDISLHQRNTMSEASGASRPHILLINPKHEDHSKKILDLRKVTNDTVKFANNPHFSSSPFGQMQSLGLLDTNVTDPMKNVTIGDIGVQYNSQFCIVFNSSYLIAQTGPANERETHQKMQQVYGQIGRLFDIDGESIYEAQNQDSKHFLEPRHDVIYEDEGYAENDYYADNQRDCGGAVTTNYDQYQTRGNQQHYQSVRSNQPSQQFRIIKRPNRNGGSYRPSQPDTGTSGQFGDFESDDMNNRDIYQDDPDLYWAIQASLGQADPQAAPSSGIPHNDETTKFSTTDPMSFENLDRKPKTPSTAENASMRQNSAPLSQDGYDNYNGGGNLIDANVAFTSPRVAQSNKGAPQGSILKKANENRQKQTMSFNELRIKNCQERREKMAEKFQQMQQQSKDLLGSKQKAIPNQAQHLQKSSKKKKMFTTQGEKYYQLEALSKMPPLKSFSQISSNLTKLHSNVILKGLDEAMLKIGQQVEYEELKKPGCKKQTKKAGKRRLQSEISLGEMSEEKKDLMTSDIIGSSLYSPRKLTERDQQVNLDQQIEQLPMDDTQSGDSHEEQDRKKKNTYGILDEMGEDIEGYEEYKEDQRCHSPQDVLKADIAKNSKSSSFRDRLYSSSGVIIEGVDETKNRKADKIDE